MRLKKKSAADRRNEPPAGRKILTARLVYPDATGAVRADGSIDSDALPQVVCPRCGAGWFDEVVQYRMAGPEIYDPTNPPDGRPARRMRIKILECRGCRQLVSLDGEGG